MTAGERTQDAEQDREGKAAAAADNHGQKNRKDGAAGGRSVRAGQAEELMRSRYAAYAVGQLDHVFRTWHPRTRPETIEPDPAIVWTGLTVLNGSTLCVTQAEEPITA